MHTAIAVIRRFAAEIFERFLATKFPSSKRFGLEGCDAVIPALHAFTRAAAVYGCERVELGMSHRYAFSD
jgi:2-oxoglutarate dehydrogenase E1 component